MSDNPLVRLRDFGQSVWCDDIGREMLDSGALDALIERDGVVGLTSNPTIFHKAITGGTAYDADIARLVARGASTSEMLDELIFSDIEAAAAKLQPVHEATGAKDGWVSVEVAPALAHDTEGTVIEVVRVRRALAAHPNILVKVPATAEGVTAIRRLVGLGYSINVTLTFSLERYAEVIEAYLGGLEELAAKERAGETVHLADIHGVASFFVSRVDTLVDKHLDALAGKATAAGESAEPFAALRGRTAIANAKAAYKLFQEKFSGPGWEALQAGGANVQRPLWASTSTKDPAYSDILYVEELIGPHTVNTMPLKTIAAYRDHGDPAETLTKGVDEALSHLATLEEMGISMAEVTAQLEREGVKAFADSFAALHQALEDRRAAGRR